MDFNELKIRIYEIDSLKKPDSIPCTEWQEWQRGFALDVCKKFWLTDESFVRLMGFEETQKRS